MKTETKHTPIPDGLLIEVTRRPGKPSIYTAVYRGKRVVAGCDKWQVLEYAIETIARTEGK